MTAPTPNDQLQARFKAMRQQMTATMVSALYQLWMGLGSYRDADIARFQTYAKAYVRGAQLNVIALTQAYMQQVARGANATWTPVSLPVNFLDGVRTGIDFTGEYARPFQQLWTALASGADIQQAVNTGLIRLKSLAETDLQLAATHASQAILEAQAPGEDGKYGIVGYERVTTSAAPCALCLIASTQRYHSEALMPIHPGCQCIVEPLYGYEPSERVIHPELLGQIHQAILDQFGAKNYSATFVPGQDFNYRDVLITHDHGEIGPVLAVRGQHFQSADDIADLASQAA